MPGRRIRLKTPLLFVIWFVFLITVGGVSGLALANAAINHSTHDIYDVIAHFHYGLSLAAASLIFAVVYIVLKRIARAPYRERLGQTHFWLFAAGSVLILLPRFGLMATSRPGRYSDYAGTFAFWRFVSSAGYAMTLIGLGVFVIAIIDALRNRCMAKKAVGL